MLYLIPYLILLMLISRHVAYKQAADYCKLLNRVYEDLTRVSKVLKREYPTLNQIHIRNLTNTTNIKLTESRGKIPKFLHKLYL